MRYMDPNTTNIYRWLYTYLNTKGKEYRHAVGPWARKQHVNHGREGHGALRAELQQISFGYDKHGHEELQWVTIKTVELSNGG